MGCFLCFSEPKSLVRDRQTLEQTTFRQAEIQTHATDRQSKRITGGERVENLNLGLLSVKRPWAAGGLFISFPYYLIYFW